MQREIKAENGKQDKYLEKDNTFLLRRRRRRRKRRKYLEKEKSIFLQRRRKNGKAFGEGKLRIRRQRRKFFGEGKYFFAEEEKEENIQRCTSILKPALFLFGPKLLRLQAQFGNSFL